MLSHSNVESLKELLSTGTNCGTSEVEMGCMGQVGLDEFHLAVDLKF